MKTPGILGGISAILGKLPAFSATVVLLGTTAAVSASQQLDTTHQHPSPAIIDGSAQPELIPDSTAYRLFFLALADAPDATDAERMRHATRLKRLNLGDADQQAASAILTGFKQQYRLLVDAFNEQARQAEAKGQQLDTQTFVTKRDQLIQATVSNLKGALTTGAWTSLSTSVQTAKQKMQISAGGAQ